MSHSIRIETTCPNNHNQTITLSKEEFEAALATDTLVFHCETCDTSWPPTKHEIEHFRKGFAAE